MSFETVILDRPTRKELEPVEEFLKQEDLLLDKKVEYTVVILDDDKIIGTGSFEKNILKCIAVDDKYRGEGISNMIASELISEEYRRDTSKLFLFTKPKNEKLFNQLGFYLLVKSEKAILLENDKHGIERYCKELVKESENSNICNENYKKIAGIVMNCNPFTFGHKYLVEQASKENEIVHLFVVDEDESIFPTEVRYKLVLEGIKEFNNVVVHRAVDYIISNSTFPTYFLKSVSEIVQSQATLDAKIFAKYIAKSLKINKRYVGNEPFSEVTRIYNEILKEILPAENIEVVEIERKEIDGVKISASRVRELLKEENFEEIKKLVPVTTYNFLISDKAKEIINKLKLM
ncbi:[citrate (pro-3S)-lyase] ligase [uncultured Clostridium sp.]|uniref:[citrate (pro-3S)-lyase] ligase n=1 Tax=uncultured Clostridium sp. TaxID=59620 RepID=UPI002630DCCA|nr:[citrate (pro-3S)-lyase] ligase [uncultured Clostridium sp.]